MLAAVKDAARRARARWPAKGRAILEPRLRAAPWELQAGTKKRPPAEPRNTGERRSRVSLAPTNQQGALSSHTPPITGHARRPPRRGILPAGRRPHAGRAVSACPPAAASPARRPIRLDRRAGRAYSLVMVDTTQRTAAPAEWLEALAESEADLAAGRTIPAEEIMRDLRESLARLEAKAAAASQRKPAARR